MSATPTYRVISGANFAFVTSFDENVVALTGLAEPTRRCAERHGRAAAD